MDAYVRSQKTAPAPPKPAKLKEAKAKTAPAAAEAPAAAPAATEEPSSVPWPQDDDLPPEERRLRLFDLDKRYGPCIGMTRSERWRRAQELGLNPPPDVHAILSSQPQAREACLWEGRV